MKSKIEKVGEFKGWQELFDWYESVYDPETNNKIAQFEVKGKKGTLLFRICYGKLLN